MAQLADDGLPNSPYSVLVQEVVPEWQQAGATHTNSPSETPTRFRFRPEQSRAAEKVKLEHRKLLVEVWARYFRLVGADDQPLDWIVPYAEDLCQKRSGEFRDRPIMTTLGQLASGAGLPRSDVALTLPMTDPFQGDGESLAQFKKRVRRAVAAYFEAAVRDSMRPPQRKSAKTVGKRDNLMHSKWLILFQSCGWTLAKIRNEYGRHIAQDDTTAIWHGIERKAQLLGIKLRHPKQKNLTK
jgi:hypothetical protein